MIISYFNYLWDIHGISAGSAIKGREFVNALRRRGHQVYLEWRAKQPVANGVHNGTNGGGADLKSKLRKYLKEPKALAVNVPNLYREYRMLSWQKPDIFFPRLTYGNFSALTLAKLMHLPTVVEADCPPTHEWQQFYASDAFQFGKLSLRLETAALNQADAVITQSNALTDYYVNLGVPAEKIVMIPNAADIRRFKPGRRDPELAKKHNLRGKTVVGWVGAGVSWTGVEALKAAARRLMAENRKVCFMMVGSPENMAWFREHLAVEGREDQLILPGFVPHEEIPRYLSCMDVVLAPYPKLEFFYASSMKLFEYMAAGKAVLATRIGQIAEVIREGENGLLFDPDTEGELEEKLTALVASKDLRKSCGAAARKDAEREYNWDDVARRMGGVFEGVLRGVGV